MAWKTPPGSRTGGFFCVGRVASTHVAPGSDSPGEPPSSSGPPAGALRSGAGAPTAAGHPPAGRRLRHPHEDNSLPQGWRPLPPAGSAEASRELEVLARSRGPADGLRGVSAVMAQVTSPGNRWRSRGGRCQGKRTRCAGLTGLWGRFCGVLGPIGESEGRAAPPETYNRQQRYVSRSAGDSYRRSVGRRTGQRSRAQDWGIHSCVSCAVRVCLNRRAASGRRDVQTL